MLRLMLRRSRLRSLRGSSFSWLEGEATELVLTRHFSLAGQKKLRHRFTEFTELTDDVDRC